LATASNAARAERERARSDPARRRRELHPVRPPAGASKRRRRQAKAVKKGVLVKNELAYYILIPTVALLLMGLVMVFSAGSVISAAESGNGYRYFTQQVTWAALGMLLMIFLARFDYHKLGKISWIGVIISLGLLVAVLLVGKQVGGARRWIEVGPLNLQPTEIAKFTLVVFACYALAMKGKNVKRFTHFLIPVVLLAAIEAGLILLQPDMGSAIVTCAAVLLVLILAGSRVSHLAMVGAAGGAAAFCLMLSASYRRARLFSFLNPWSKARGSGYQVIQSYIALGSGNIKGLGLGMSRQKFLYLPNAHTDFIFAIIGEELGILGTLAVVSLIALLGIGGFRIANRAPDKLGRLLAAGITGLIVIQALVNMGGVTGLLPITGVPLPLVSFGGSSLCVCMGCIGILLNVAAQSSP